LQVWLEARRRQEGAISRRQRRFHEVDADFVQPSMADAAYLCGRRQLPTSLLPSGCMLYELIPTMPELRLLPLIERFAAMLADPPVFADTFEAV
jgi:hypothetical protein